MGTYTINLFPNQGPQDLSDGNARSGENASSGFPRTAVCFSGGGSRSLSATMGQLRGLRALGVLDKTMMISGVSGGAWASTVYSFVPETISDDDLLGAVCEDPSKLTWDTGKNPDCSLDYLPPGNIGALPGNMGILEFTKDAVEMYSKGIPTDEVWVRLVGEYIFKPYGLYSDYGKSNYFTSNEGWFDYKIRSKNASLKYADFYSMPSDRYRPALFVYGSVFPNSSKGEYELLPVLMSPFYAGVMSEFPGEGIDGSDIGGGGVDPFGFNSTTHTSAGENLQTIDIPANKFSLADMAGISSAFFAEIISADHPEFDGLIPKYSYWPVMNADSNAAHTYSFADGGDLDNSGVASMLRQRPENVIAFLNTSVPLSYDHDLLTPVVDDQVPPLFGYQPYTKGKGYVKYSEPLLDPSYAVFKDNQVFDDDQAFQDYLITLWNAYVAKGTAMCYQQNVTLKPNAKYGVSSGTVNMLWVYNNMVQNWWNQLSLDVRAAIDLDPVLYGSFPNYSTADVGLTARQVNLLAHLSCWNIISDNTDGNPDGQTNAQMFKNMYQ